MQPCSAPSSLSVLLLPAVIVAAWAISLLDTAVWAPGAFAILTASAAVSWWMDRGGKAKASSSGSEVLSPEQTLQRSSGEAPSPEQTLQLIKSRRSVFPKDFSGELQGLSGFMSAIRQACTVVVQ